VHDNIARTVEEFKPIEFWLWWCQQWVCEFCNSTSFRTSAINKCCLACNCLVILLEAHWVLVATHDFRQRTTTNQNLDHKLQTMLCNFHAPYPQRSLRPTLQTSIAPSNWQVHNWQLPNWKTIVRRNWHRTSSWCNWHNVTYISEISSMDIQSSRSHLLAAIKQVDKSGADWTTLWKQRAVWRKKESENTNTRC
jgi:hypothetical protein